MTVEELKYQRRMKFFEDKYCLYRKASKVVALIMIVLSTAIGVCAALKDRDPILNSIGIACVVVMFLLSLLYAVFHKLEMMYFKKLL